MRSTPKVILVTGSREFNDKQMLWAVLSLHSPDVLIHGDAKGADSLARMWCGEHRGVYEIRVPAKWDILGRQAGMDRNRVMLSLSPDRVLAFFRTGAENRGTTGMAGIARAAGIPVEAFWS